MEKSRYGDESRRKFLYQLGVAGMGIPLLSLSSCNDGDERSKQHSMTNKKDNEGKLGIALVGLGDYATTQLAPALEKTQHCYLAGIVTGTPAKADAWKEKYQLPEKNIYNYGNFDSIKDNKDIDIVYVVLPNNMHAEYTVRAAQAGKHVICEKPMAISVAECDKMIAACKKAGKLLSIGYRLHFDPYHLEMSKLIKQGAYGTIN